MVSNDGTCKKEQVNDTEISLPIFVDNKVRYFLYQLTRYVWMKDLTSFVNVQTFNEKSTIASLMENTNGLNKKQQSEL